MPGGGKACVANGDPAIARAFQASMRAGPACGPKQERLLGKELSPLSGVPPRRLGVVCCLAGGAYGG